MGLKVLLVNDDLQFINLEDKDMYENISSLCDTMLEKISNQRKCKKDIVLFSAQRNKNTKLERVIRKVLILKELENMYERR